MDKPETLIDFDRFWADVDAKLEQEDMTYMEAVAVLDMTDPASYGRVMGRPVNLGDLLVWAHWLERPLHEYAADGVAEPMRGILVDLGSLDAQQTRGYLREAAELSERKSAVYAAIREQWPQATQEDL